MSENSKTILYAAAMTLIVAIVLAGLSTWLKPIQQVELNKDKKVNILKAVAFNEFMEPESEYKKRIREVVVNSEGKEVTGTKAFDIVLKKEYAKPLAERKYPIYVYTADSKEQKFIVPLVGMGLWDEINGFVALKDDFRTMDGASFGHVGETPGLGAEITTEWFQGQFKNKTVCDAAGKYDFKVLKGRGNNLTDNTIDGITGATITCDGLGEMIEKCYTAYGKYFTAVERNAMASSETGENIVSSRVKRLTNRLFTNNGVINFVKNSSIINNGSTDMVEALAVYLRNNPDKRVQISVDDTKASYNLANRRAETVLAYAVQKGANPKQLEFVTKNKAQNGAVNFKVIR